jgi:SAM-dependent methyltransferase
MKSSNHTSPDADVRSMYDGFAETYDAMMDDEINAPLYDDMLGRLAGRIENLTGPVVDVACGSGQMLVRYRDRHDGRRALVGIDLSGEMVALTQKKLKGAVIRIGDMRAPGIDNAAALICFFALHHLDADDAARAFHAWRNALQPGGQLLLGTWEGEGVIDYGGQADLVALRYRVDDVKTWASNAGFRIDRCDVKPVEEMPMDAIYLEATRVG